jgi:hypothetical protein
MQSSRDIPFSSDSVPPKKSEWFTGDIAQAKARFDTLVRVYVREESEKISEMGERNAQRDKKAFEKIRQAAASGKKINKTSKKIKHHDEKMVEASRAQGLFAQLAAMAEVPIKDFLETKEDGSIKKDVIGSAVIAKAVDSQMVATLTGGLRAFLTNLGKNSKKIQKAIDKGSKGVPEAIEYLIAFADQVKLDHAHAVAQAIKLIEKKQHDETLQNIGEKRSGSPSEERSDTSEAQHSEEISSSFGNAPDLTTAEDSELSSESSSSPPSSRDMRKAQDLKTNEALTAELTRLKTLNDIAISDAEELRQRLAAITAERGSAEAHTQTDQEVTHRSDRSVEIQTTPSMKIASTSTQTQDFIDPLLLQLREENSGLHRELDTTQSTTQSQQDTITQLRAQVSTLQMSSTASSAAQEQQLAGLRSRLEKQTAENQSLHAASKQPVGESSIPSGSDIAGVQAENTALRRELEQSTLVRERERLERAQEKLAEVKEKQVAFTAQITALNLNQPKEISGWKKGLAIAGAVALGVAGGALIGFGLTAGFGLVSLAGAAALGVIAGGAAFLPVAGVLGTITGIKSFSEPVKEKAAYEKALSGLRAELTQANAKVETAEAAVVTARTAVATAEAVVNKPKPDERVAAMAQTIVNRLHDERRGSAASVPSIAGTVHSFATGIGGHSPQEGPGQDQATRPVTSRRRSNGGT